MGESTGEKSLKKREKLSLTTSSIFHRRLFKKYFFSLQVPIERDEKKKRQVNELVLSIMLKYCSVIPYAKGRNILFFVSLLHLKGNGAYREIYLYGKHEHLTNHRYTGFDAIATT